MEHGNHKRYGMVESEALPTIQSLQMIRSQKRANQGGGAPRTEASLVMILRLARAKKHL